MSMAATAKKLPSGNWRCRPGYTDEKGKHRTASFTEKTKKAAEAAAAKFLVEREHKAQPENKTLGELADIFIEDRTNLLSPSTIRGYRTIRKTAFQSITDYRVSLLTKGVYQKAVNEYAEGRSYKTVLSAHVFYNKVLKDNNIFIGEGVKLPPKEKKEIKIPTTEEVAQYLRSISGTRLYLYCLFSVCLGLRKSETLALQWHDIDLVQNTVSITKAKVRNEFGDYVVKQTKTDSGVRRLHLPRIVRGALGEAGAEGEYIINDSPKALESLYNRSRKAYGFPYNFHALRHYYASMMLLSGMPNKYAQEQMGHSTEDMLTKVYQHTFKTERDKFAIGLDDIWDASFSMEEEKTELDRYKNLKKKKVARMDANAKILERVQQAEADTEGQSKIHSCRI